MIACETMYSIVFITIIFTTCAHFVAPGGRSLSRSSSSASTAHAAGTGMIAAAIQKSLHPRNKHINGYDFHALKQFVPELAPYISTSVDRDRPSVDWANPLVVKLVNKALLLSSYTNVISHWDMPPGCLIPGIPGRADYIHHVADLIAASPQIDKNKDKVVKGLDIGCGSSCIYPLLGHCEYGWQFVASEIDASSTNWARSIVQRNGLSAHIDVRQQFNHSQIFAGIIQPTDVFDFSVCNPPFHTNGKAASDATKRKWQNLKKSHLASESNFSGRKNELYCLGGEVGFVSRMIDESRHFKSQVCWFTSLVSKADHLPPLMKALDSHDDIVRDVRVVDMEQGNKKSRVLAWTFMG